uniref:Synaptobrevin, longin-like domain protein n=1 Tax=Tanacetum cinerariifolium TaxID=118510 RepID=A0A6L2KLX2_TANCI|nr:synaptobrevin, longin-like domain protein [Tanacetum cinerariifolium]
MAALRYKDEHNKVGYLLKPTRSDDYHHIIDFLRAFHIRYALTHNPIIFDSLVKQFWSTATLRAPELGPPAILATIDKTPYTIIEDLVRSQLQLANDGGITNLPIAEIYSGMGNLGYVPEGMLTFFKNKFSPQWRFLVHTLLHYLSTKSGSWDQFGRPFAVDLICLSDGRRFNWSSYIFKGMVSNIRNAKKFLMYLRFLQTILGIETRVTRQYKVLVFSSKLFANMRLNFAGHPMPLLPAMLLQAQAGAGAEFLIMVKVLTQILLLSLGLMRLMLAISQLWKMPLWEAIFIPLHQGPLKLPLQKVHSLKSELKDHKKLFKDVVGKLVKKVKALEVKLKTKKRKIVVSDSDQVDDDIPSGSTSQILAASPSVPTAAFPGTSDVPLHTSAVPTGASTIPAGSLNVPTDVPSSAAPVCVSSKGKSAMVEEDIPVKARTFKKMEENRLGEEAAKWLHAEEIAQLERQRAEVKRKRQQDVLDSAMYYNKADWLNIRAQVEANASLSKTLLGDDVSEDNFPARMAALIKRKRQALAEQLAKERHNRLMTQAQQKAYMRQYVKNQKPSSKRQQSSEAPIPLVPDVPLSPDVSSHPSSYTKRKSLGRKHILKPKSTLPKLDLDADAQTFIKVVVNEDSDDEGKGFLCLATSKSVGDKKLEAIHSFQCSCFGNCVWRDIVGNDMTTAEQLIQFIKNQLAAAQASYHVAGSRFPEAFSMLLVQVQLCRYVVPTSRVIVATGRYVVPTGRVIVPTGRSEHIPQEDKTCVPISSYEFSTLNSASNVVLEGNWHTTSSSPLLPTPSPKYLRPPQQPQRYRPPLSPPLTSPSPRHLQPDTFISVSTPPLPSPHRRLHHPRDHHATTTIPTSISSSPSRHHPHVTNATSTAATTSLPSPLSSTIRVCFV